MMFNQRIYGLPGTWWFRYWCWIHLQHPSPEMPAVHQKQVEDLVVDLPFERDFVELNNL